MLRVTNRVKIEGGTINVWCVIKLSNARLEYSK